MYRDIEEVLIVFVVRMMSNGIHIEAWAEYKCQAMNKSSIAPQMKRLQEKTYFKSSDIKAE